MTLTDTEYEIQQKEALQDIIQTVQNFTQSPALRRALFARDDAIKVKVSIVFTKEIVIETCIRKATTEDKI